jgi:hypothetical protein
MAETKTETETGFVYLSRAPGFDVILYFYNFLCFFILLSLFSVLCPMLPDFRYCLFLIATWAFSTVCYSCLYFRVLLFKLFLFSIYSKSHLSMFFIYAFCIFSTI